MILQATSCNPYSQQLSSERLVTLLVRLLVALSPGPYLQLQLGLSGLQSHQGGLQLAQQAAEAHPQAVILPAQLPVRLLQLLVKHLCACCSSRCFTSS